MALIGRRGTRHRSKLEVSLLYAPMHELNCPPGSTGLDLKYLLRAVGAGGPRARGPSHPQIFSDQLTLFPTESMVVPAYHVLLLLLVSPYDYYYYVISIYLRHS